MLYKYETHMHTSEGSLCSSSSAEEMAMKYKSEGYTGVFVTDHFFNGNCAVPKDLPWDEKVDRYCLGYEHAKAKGDEIGLDVFFGVEFGNGETDLLTYGIDKHWLKAHPEIMDMPFEEYVPFARAEGAMVIQAHPFREAPYIHKFVLVHGVDGIEILNDSMRGDRSIFNDRAKIYAGWYDLPVTAGSDAHNTTDRFYGGGVALEHRIKSPSDYISAVKERKLSFLLSDGNYIELQ